MRSTPGGGSAYYRTGLVHVEAGRCNVLGCAYRKGSNFLQRASLLRKTAFFAIGDQLDPGRWRQTLLRLGGIGLLFKKVESFHEADTY